MAPTRKWREVLDYETDLRELLPVSQGALPGGIKGQTVRSRALLRRPWFVNLLALGVMLAGWEYIAAVNARVPDISSVLAFLGNEISGGSHGGMLRGEFWGPLGLSMRRYGLGLLIGLPLGALIGILIGGSRWARGLLNDTVLVLLALPSLVWAFLASLWLGISETAPVVAVVLTSLPFLAINIGTGVRSIDPALREMSAAFKVSRMHKLSMLLIGGSLPSIFGGLRLALIGGWNSLLIVEWFGSTSGVGWRAHNWWDSQRYAGFVGWILVFVVVIIVVNRFVLTPLERLVMPTEARSEVQALGRGTATTRRT